MKSPQYEVKLGPLWTRVIAPIIYPGGELSYRSARYKPRQMAQPGQWRMRLVDVAQSNASQQ